MHARKRCGFVRTTISLPWELHRRMRHCGREVNWSAVAARAFAEEVGRRAAQQTDADIDDVVARLLAVPAANPAASYFARAPSTVKSGRCAATAVELSHLHRASRHARMGRGANWENWLSSIDCEKPPAEVFARLIGRDSTAGMGSEDVQLWKSAEYVHGFSAGAIHLWKQVARRMPAVSK